MKKKNDKLPYSSIIGSIAGRDQMQITINAISASMQSVINGKFLGMPRPISRDWILFTGEEIGPNYKSWQNYVNNYIKNEALKEDEK